MVIDKNGYPHIAYSVYKTNKDHRYRITSWDGTIWHDREVGLAGTALYDMESSYTGLITLDPVDPSYVVISTDIEPRKNANFRITKSIAPKLGLWIREKRFAGSL